MTSKFVLRMLVLVGLQCLWCALASAQSAPTQPAGCYLILTANDLGIDLGAPPPPGAVLVNQNTIPGEGGLSLYRVTDPTCPPPKAPKEKNCCPTCGGCGNSAGAPISLVNGNTYIVQTDVKVPGLSDGLVLSRNWNSKWPSTQSAFQVGLFGPNWRSTYEERIFVGSDNYVKYARSDGSFWSFACPTWTSCGLVAPANVTATLSVGSNYSNWTVTFQNGEKRVFSYLSGSLTSIIDRNGNTTQLTYDALNRPVTVADPGGRHLYFTYASNSSYLVTGVSSDVGISLSYAYDSQGRLSQVTKPDLTTLSFAYDSNSLITTVTDSAGKILESHTYDSQGRGLTSSRANGVEGVTVSYSGQ
jgi:YD repeat-containing protein